MGADGAVPVKKPLFAKPSIDDMGPGTDMPTPAGAVSRSLFKKQSADEAHGSDFGIPGEPAKPLFKKNSLDEMTVRRTEKPVEGKVPAKPQPISPRGGDVRQDRGGRGGSRRQTNRSPARRHRLLRGSRRRPSRKAAARQDRQAGEVSASSFSPCGRRWIGAPAPRRLRGVPAE